MDRVYVVTEGTWGLKRNGTSPDQIQIEEVRSIRESPSRLSPSLANKLYDADESGMGYTFFGIELRYGRVLACSAGNAVDFLEMPEGLSAKDIVDVIPHWGRERWHRTTLRAKGADFKWCLY
jgi:hypothetical protein